MTGIFDRITRIQPDDTMEAVGESEGSSDEYSPSLAAEAPQDEPRTPQRIRDAVQELLKYGLLEESQKPNLYRAALANTENFAHLLEPLDLAMGVDEVRGLVFITVRQTETVDQDDWAHPLVRRQRLNLEQSLLIAILRQHFIAYEQESGTGASLALIAIDELVPQLQVYLGDLGSQARERTRIIGLLDQLKNHGLVSAPDAHDRVVIRPIITHLANPENLQAMLAWLQTHQGSGLVSDDDEEGDPA
jgi:hypothetical protein